MRTSPSQRVGWRYLGVTLAALAGAVWVTWHYELSMPATVVALLPGLGTSYLAWAQFRADRQEAASAAAGQVTLGQVADQFAVAVRAQWEAEAAHQRLNDPHPLPVAWLPADPSLVEAWHDLVTTAYGWPGGPSTNPATWAAGPAGLAGAGNDLAEVLARVPTGRLVVLGEPGAGKTMLLVRLLLDLLARRAPGGPVPVLVSLAAWNPVEDDLATWLTSGETSNDCVNAGFVRRSIDAAAIEGRQRNGVAVRRTSGPMRTTSSSWKRLASAMLGAPGPASAGLPPPPINTGAM
jgi:hypothetical protein